MTALDEFKQRYLNENKYSEYEILDAFEKALPENFSEFKTSELAQFVQTLFTEEQQQLFDAMLEIISQLPYSQTYERRSYRSPKVMNLHSERIFELIEELKKQPEFDIYKVFDAAGDEDYIDGSMMYVTTKGKPIVSSTLFPYIIALKLNEQDARMEEIIREILWKNGAHPHFSRDLLRGIMISKHEEMQQLVANVLLAAKNQEGVRQVITETIDEGTLQAQLSMMKVILDNNLLRFSSVARAVDVWFGLGYDTTDVKNLNYALETGFAALQDEKLSEKLLKSKSNLDVFIGLWSMGSHDATAILNSLDALFQEADYIQQTVLYTLRNMNFPDSYAANFAPYSLKMTNLKTFIYSYHLIVNELPTAYYYPSEDEEDEIQEFFDNHPWFAENATLWLEKINQMMEEFKGDVHIIDETPFTFLNYSFHKLELFKLQLLLATYLKKEDQLEVIAQSIKNKPVAFREYFYFFVPMYIKNYDMLLPAIKDRSMTIRLNTINLFKDIKWPLEKFEAEIPSLLALKTGELRIAVIELLKLQPIEEIEALAETILRNKKENVRLGMIELLVEKKDVLTRDWAKFIEQPTEKEQTLLTYLGAQKETVLSKPLDAVRYSTPPITEISFSFKDFIHYDFKALKMKLKPLRQLIDDNKYVEYEASDYSDEVEITLVGEYLTSDAKRPETIGSIDQLALAEVWVEWLLQSDLTAEDICCYAYAKKLEEISMYDDLTKTETRFLKTYFSGKRQSEVMSIFEDALYEDQVSTIMAYVVATGTADLQGKLINHFQSMKPALDYMQFCSSMLLATTMEEVLAPREVDDLVYKNSHYYIYEFGFFKMAFFEMGIYARTVKQVNQLFYTLEQYFDELDDFIEYLTLESILIAFDEGIITEAYLSRLFLNDEFNYVFSFSDEDLDDINKMKNAEQVITLIQKLKLYIIEQELNRGDLMTEVTNCVYYIDSIEGVDYFIRILNALEGEKLSRLSMGEIESRKDSLSALLEKVDIDLDEQAVVNFEKLSQAGFTEKRLVEAMLYNSNLIPFLSRYIGWDGLEEVAWYFIAHTTESTSEYEDAKIMEYSEIPPQDFERGAFDRNWFMEASEKLTSKQFKLVFDAAKYAASGSNHRRAQLYAQASLGELVEEDLKKEILNKRNKDKLRAYSLIPANFEQAKERYVFFQQFLKESRQFGAQRRASEAEAVEMAIQNLAQQVSSGNTTQFIWLMELERYQELKQYFTPIEIEGVQLNLIQKESKVEIEIIKADKPLKSIPKKIAKQATVLAMIETKKELTEQSRRVKHQLEQAMCEEVLFDSTIIYALCEMESFSAILSQLVWRQNNNFFVLEHGEFKSMDDQVQIITDDVQIAHPAHFYEVGNWRSWQHYIFDRQWKQPFKQVFREFYMATADEVEKVFTNRLEGYQVQPKKAITLLKSRGWKVGYYEPVRKISYRYNLITHIDFIYDAYTPAEVEAPTLSDVYFEERLTSENKKLGEVPAVYFSEIMRDLDLVVSVAHAGEVDPEASHSTIEMRATIAEEIIQLFQLNNVQVKEPHILVEGELGNYSIHLGSGNVHQLGGSMIPITTIPSQHRGRVFLPFVDEDPKTAEISAKLLLFADDAAINDPQIRRMIQL